MEKRFRALVSTDKDSHIKALEKPMDQYLLWAAAVVSLATFWVHTFVGGKFVAKPLLQNTNLPRASKWLNYYCWHVVTVYTSCMSGAYAYLSFHRDQVALLIFLTLTNTLFSALSALVAVKGKFNPLVFPSTSLFAAAAVLGGLSLLFI